VPEKTGCKGFLSFQLISQGFCAPWRSPWVFKRWKKVSHWQPESSLSPSWLASIADNLIDL
jgi:hypothetical protein